MACGVSPARDDSGFTLAEARAVTYDAVRRSSSRDGQEWEADEVR